MRLTKDVEVLSAIPLFATINPANLKSLACTSERLECLSGDELFHQDDYADCRSSDDLRQRPGLGKGGSGLRMEAMRPGRDAASGDWRWSGV